MLIKITGVLTQDEVARVRAALAGGTFVDGNRSVGVVNQGVKNNEEFQRPSAQPTEADQIVGQALMRNPTFQDFALPAKLPPPMYNRYGPGMNFEAHIDSPILGERMVFRADLSFTLFLTNPSEYEGGELIIDTGIGEQAVKLDPGDAVVYSSGRLHRVAPITRGERLCAIGWLQSRVRDEAMREILYDLACVSKELHNHAEARGGIQPGAEREVYNRLYKVYANLIRTHADT